MNVTFSVNLTNFYRTVKETRVGAVGPVQAIRAQISILYLQVKKILRIVNMA